MKNYDLYQHQRIDTIRDFVFFCKKEYGSRPAFVFSEKGEDKVISYQEFADEVNSVGAGLLDRGIRECKIAVLGENSYYWILSYFAVVCSGNVIVPLDKELDTDSIVELLEDSECKVLIYSDTYADVVAEMETVKSGIAYMSMKTLDDLLQEGEQIIEKSGTEYTIQSIKTDDMASIVYTSGTTGKSKGVVLTHGNLMSDMYGACCNVMVKGSSLLVLPLHHTYGLVAGVFVDMFYGESIYINQSLRNLLKDFQTSKPQHIFAVPLIVETIHKNIWNTARKSGKEKLLKGLIKLSDCLLKVGIDLRRKLFRSVLQALGGNIDLIVSGGAPIDEKYIKAFHSFGITVLNGYGITECGPVVAVNRNKFQVEESVGMPLCCNEVKIDEDGEILVRGSNVMSGYYRNEEENKKAFKDGWFKTGDLGFLDKKGALHITGRKKNLIILSNGENVAAEELERKIYTITYVSEVIVYESEKVITAEIFLDEQVADARERINKDIQKINRTLPLTKNIGKVVIRDTEFPKTTTKKIKRNYKGA